MGYWALGTVSWVLGRWCTGEWASLARIDGLVFEGIVIKLCDLCGPGASIRGMGARTKAIVLILITAGLNMGIDIISQVVRRRLKLFAKRATSF